PRSIAGNTGDRSHHYQSIGFAAGGPESEHRVEQCSGTKRRSEAMKKLLLLMFAMMTVAAFASGPKYKKPDIEVPANWQAEAPFLAASPQDSLPKGKWWEMFGNAELNSYEEHALQSNQ